MKHLLSIAFLALTGLLLGCSDDTPETVSYGSPDPLTEWVKVNVLASDGSNLLQISDDASMPITNIKFTMGGVTSSAPRWYTEECMDIFEGWDKNYVSIYPKWFFVLDNRIEANTTDSPTTLQQLLRSYEPCLFIGPWNSPLCLCDTIILSFNERNCEIVLRSDDGYREKFIFVDGQKQKIARYADSLYNHEDPTQFFKPIIEFDLTIPAE